MILDFFRPSPTSSSELSLSYCSSSSSASSSPNASNPNSAACGDSPTVMVKQEIIDPEDSSVDFKSLPKNVAPTVCAVCGLAANGYHYEVPSCNGCKTFFRRSILAERKYECRNAANCYVYGNQGPNSTRKKVCRACRFNKCVAVGMNPHAIQIRESQEANRALQKRRTDDAEVSASKMFLALNSAESRMNDVIENLVYLEIKVDQFRSSAYSPKPMDAQSLEATLKSNCCFSISDKVGPLQRCFNEENSFKRQKIWYYYDIVTTIEYAKAFMFLHQMDMEDRINLMRYVTLMCFNLTQGFFSFSIKSDRIVYPDGSFGGPPPKRCEESQAAATHKEQLQKTTIALIRTKIDRQEYVLLKALVLCNPAVPGLSLRAQEILADERSKYSKALFNYCMTHHGPSTGPARFSAILGLVDVLEHQQKNQKDYHVLLTLNQREAAINKLVLDIMR